MRVPANGSWTVDIPEGMAQVDNGDSWQAYDERLVVYVGALSIADELGGAHPHAEIAAAAADDVPASAEAERLSHDNGLVTGHATVGPAELAYAALDQAIASVSEGGPLIPFLFIERSADRDLQRFTRDTLEEGQAALREAVAQLDDDVTAYAMAYDGYMTFEGKKCDAILSEAAERGAPSGVFFVQRYQPKKGMFGKFKRVGRVGSGGRCNDGCEPISWSLEGKRLARTTIEARGHGVEVGLSVDRQIGLLREVLA